MLNSFYYSLPLNRYTQPDPMGLLGNYALGEGSSTQFNLYTYALNDPINKKDETGLWTNPTGGRIRGCDCCGCGYFGADRKNEKGQYYPHDGVDILGVTFNPWSIRAESGGISSGGSTPVHASGSIGSPRDSGPLPPTGSKPVKAVIGGKSQNIGSDYNKGVMICGGGWCIREQHMDSSVQNLSGVREGQYIGTVKSGAGQCGKPNCHDVPDHVHVEAYKEPGEIRYNPTPIVNNSAPIP